MPEEQRSNRFQSQSSAAQSEAQPSTGRLLERGRQAEGDAHSFAANLEGLVSDAEELLRARLETQPYATLAMAAGAGFIVGGGVTLGVLTTIAGLGTRMATASMLKTTLARVFSRLERESSTIGASHEVA
jgi:ElaB/YqjD/DUF883 family membrane-anchored ribosome-binding protein